MIETEQKRQIKIFFSKLRKLQLLILYRVKLTILSKALEHDVEHVESCNVFYAKLALYIFVILHE